MAAIVTDQFRILNASNFIDSVTSGNDSYYVFLGLDNPASVGFGRTTNWNENKITNWPGVVSQQSLLISFLFLFLSLSIYM